MAADVTQTKEALAVLGALAVAIKEAKADGVVNWVDLPKLAPLIVAVRVAVDQGSKIPAEVLAAVGDPAALADLIGAVVTDALALVDAIIGA